MVLIFVDAAVFSDMNQSTFGAIAEDASGVFMVAKSGFTRCMNDAPLVEAMAVKEALSWAKVMGYGKVKIFTQCQVVCNLLRG